MKILNTVKLSILPIFIPVYSLWKIFFEHVDTISKSECYLSFLPKFSEMGNGGENENREELKMKTESHVGKRRDR